MIKCTDRYTGSGIYMSLSALYTHKEKAEVIHRLVKKTVPEFRKLLSIPRDIQFRIAPIKSKTTKGTYESTSKLVHIDCRLPWDEALEVLAHELVHAEQYHTGKLKKKYTGRKGWMHYWYGEEGSKGTTYNAYREQPWEQEAWSRQAALAEQVYLTMEKKYEAK